MMSCILLLLYILNHKTTLYRDFAAGVGRTPLACCFEIFAVCPRALEVAN